MKKQNNFSASSRQTFFSILEKTRPQYQLPASSPEPSQSPLESSPQNLEIDRSFFLVKNSNISTEKIKKLSAYHLKSSFVLNSNVARFIEKYGLENCGFLTLTFPDNVKNHKEASRRFNVMNIHFLSCFYGEWIWTRERQKRGSWHYHLIVQTKGDIRTGFDWDEYEKWISDFSAGHRRRLKTGNPFLRSLWSLNNSSFKKYGFGRVELLPIRSSGEALAQYVGKYISKQIDQRPDTDKGVRLTSHSSGFPASKPSFSWNTEGGKQWRRKLALFVQHCCCLPDHETFLSLAPRRWAFKFKDDIFNIDLHLQQKFPESAPF